MKKYFILFIVLCFKGVFAQEEHTLKFISQVHQSGWVNPVNQPRAKVSVGLPVISSIYLGVYNTGFTFNDVVKRVNDTTAELQLKTLADKLQKTNFIGLNNSIALFSLTISKSRFTAGFSINNRTNFQFQYPGDLLKFAVNGNGAYLGEDLQLGNFGVNFSNYMEYGFLFSTKIKKKFTLGVRPKFLAGIANINTKQTSLKLYTEPNFYGLSAVADYQIQMSAPIDSAEQEQLQNTSTILNFATAKYNKGMGLDIALKYQYTENISITAGISDLGRIKWNAFTHQFAFKDSIKFDGVTSDILFNNSNSTGRPESINRLDSIANNLSSLKTSGATYTTWLPANYYAMANYDFNKHHGVGVSLAGTKYSNIFIKSFTLNYQLKYKHFTGAVSYTAKSRMPFNLGGALVFQFLNTQWYFITDNWYSVLKPLNSKNVNLRFGINVVVGDKEKVKKEKAEKANEEKKNELLIKSPEMPKDKGSIEDKNETKEAKKLRREQEKIEAQQDKVQEKLLNEQKKAEEKKKKEIERAEKIQKKIDDQKKAEEEKLKQQNPNIEQPNK